MDSSKGSTDTQVTGREKVLSDDPAQIIVYSPEELGSWVSFWASFIFSNEV